MAGLSVFNATPESWMSCETSPGTENMANLLLKNAARFGFSGYLRERTMRVRCGGGVDGRVRSLFGTHALSSKTPSAMLQKPELLVR
jgi:hypothetical protein